MSASNSNGDKRDRSRSPVPSKYEEISSARLKGDRKPQLKLDSESATIPQKFDLVKFTNNFKLNILDEIKSIQWKTIFSTFLGTFEEAYELTCLGISSEILGNSG